MPAVRAGDSDSTIYQAKHLGLLGQGFYYGGDTIEFASDE
jgi:hypothetical protein